MCSPSSRREGKDLAILITVGKQNFLVSVTNSCQETSTDYSLELSDIALTDKISETNNKHSAAPKDGRLLHGRALTHGSLPPGGAFSAMEDRMLGGAVRSPQSRCLYSEVQGPSRKEEFGGGTGYKPEDGNTQVCSRSYFKKRAPSPEQPLRNPSRCGVWIHRQVDLRVSR